MKKKSSYFKSKKGFSLLELLCAVVVIAIVVAGTASGLAVSHRSILIGAEKDKASARAQEYCDIIMTYVEYTPDSHLFSNTGSCELKDDIKGKIENDIKEGNSNVTEIKQTTAAEAEAVTREKNNAVPCFVIAKSETSGDNSDSGSDSGSGGLVFYEITVYVDYANSATTYCTGTVAKTTA